VRVFILGWRRLEGTLRGFCKLPARKDTISRMQARVQGAPYTPPLRVVDVGRNRSAPRLEEGLA
jgi:hypothetical protein